MDTAYAQNNNFLPPWDDNLLCIEAQQILDEQNKSFEQLVWISKDMREREKFLADLTSDEIDVILSCVKNNLPDSKSEIITKKIGFFEGQNNHEAIGSARIITIENRDYLRFENFEIELSGSTNPNLHVYLSQHGDFENGVYLEKLKTKVGSKNYPLQDIGTFDTVVIYDEISKEIFATVSLSDPSFLVDTVLGIYHSFKADIEYPKIESKIIYTKTGILQGIDGAQALGHVTTPFEEDEAELKFENFKITAGYDFHLYATEDGSVRKSGDWTFGPDNAIYVSSTNTNEILRYTSDTGEFIDVFVSADDNGGLQGPKDLVFSSDGKSLFVSSFLTNEILLYDGNTGKFLEKIIDSNDEHVELKRPMKMLLDDDVNHLYVANVDSNEVLKYDLKTKKILYIISGGLENVETPTFVDPTSIALDKNEMLYVSSTNTNEILRYTSDTGEFIDIFVSADDNGGLQGPKDLVFSSDGKSLFVSSFLTNEILLYDGNTGKFLEKIVSSHNGDVSNPKYFVYGPDDILYVSSMDTDQILRFDKSNGKLLDVFADRKTGNIKSPRGITFGPNGDLFVANGEDHSILRFTQNNTTPQIFVEPNQSLINSSLTDENNFIPRGLVDPEGIVFHPSCYSDLSSNSKNNVFEEKQKSNDLCYFLVSSSKNHLIFRYVYNENTESTFKDVFVDDDKIKNPQSLVFGPDKNLYVSSFDTDEILRFDGTTGEFIDVFASRSGLDGPVGILFDENTSSFFVTSNNNNKIFQYHSKDGSFLNIFANEGNEIILRPESIVKGPDNLLSVSSSETNQILQYDLDDGSFIGKFVSDKSGGLYGPKDLAFDNNGNICVNSLVSHDLKCYDVHDGNLQSIIDISFDRGFLGKPYSDFGPDGELYVSDPLSNTVSRYDRNSNLFSSKILSGEEEPLQGPRNLVFGPDENLYVTSNNNHQILQLDGKTGEFIDIFVTRSSGGLSAPQDLVFHDDSLYVTSHDNHRVLRYDQVTGKFIDDFVKSRDGGLISPRGLVFDDKNNLYVASNGNHKILRYNGLTGVFEKELETGDELRNPVGLAIDNNGNLIVSSSGTDTILSYDLSSPILKLKTLIPNTHINDPTSLLIDNEHDLLYVSSTKSNRVLTYDFKSDEINEIKELTNTGKLENPYGLTIRNGELFISIIQSNSILNFNTNSNSSKLFHSGSFGVIGPLELTFDRDGNMYVISGKNHDIFRYDARSGDLLGLFSSFPFSETSDESYLTYGQLQDLVFSPDGKYLYVTSMYTDQVLRFNGFTGEFIDVFIDSNKDGLTHPQNIVYSQDKKSFYINSFDTGSIFSYDVETGNLIEKFFVADIPINIKNIKFGPDSNLYLTINDYAQVMRLDPMSNSLKEFDLGGIYLGDLDQNLLKTKYLLNHINTTRYDTLVVHDRLLEKQFATISLQDDLMGDFLPLPVVKDMLIGNLGIVEEPIFESKNINKQSGYFDGLNEIPTIGQVKLAQTEDIVTIILETFEIRYNQDQYASFTSNEGITKGPRIIACLTTGIENNCDDSQDTVIVLGPLMSNVGDQMYQVKNVNLKKFDTILLYDILLDQEFAQIALRDAAFFRLSPQLFVDWTYHQFPAFPLLLLGFIAFPLTFDYVRTIFKILFSFLVSSTS